MPKVIAKMIAESLGGEGEGKTLVDRVKNLEGSTRSSSGRSG